jgi:leucyl-tRNA synthetase
MIFNTAAIEANARKKWKDLDVYKVSNQSPKPKYYILDMFPYPSGSGLHVGHPLGYVATDIFARYKRLKGFNVLHPMGFDDFGLPAEQYAIETGQHPKITTEKNVAYYKKQLKNLGFSYDWSRQVNTSHPDFFKWTQWGFMQLFNTYFNDQEQKAKPIEQLVKKFEKDGGNGFSAAVWNSMSEKEQSDVLMQYRLAYVAYAEVNWCEALGTVLANDEVINGKSERGGHPVTKKRMRQWFLRITQYADRLLTNLDGLDWPDSLKDMQRNWIGKSEGAELNFSIEGLADIQLKIFTTRPDTIFGATFMVIAPEHPLVDQLVTDTEKKTVHEYIEYCKSRSDIERQSEKKVTGAFTGAFAIHPFTGAKLPIYLAEYVLVGYGTGAIMAVPADDERDKLFAAKYQLPVIEIVDKSEFPNAVVGDKVGRMIHSDFLNGKTVKEAIPIMIDQIETMGIGKRKINFKLRDANFSRQRYWGEPFPVLWKNDIPYLLAPSELPLINPEVDEFRPSEDGSSPLARNQQWVHEHSGYTRETDTMPGFAGSCWYFLRYMDPHNENALASKEAIDYWGQVDFYLGGSEHAVGHLLYARFWNNFLCDIGIINFQEPFKKLVNQGMIQGRSSIVYRSIKDSNKFISKGLIEQVEGGVTPIHVDVNIVHNDILDIEAFKTWREEYAHAEFVLEGGQYICGWEIEKMSKRYFNVVNPDDMVAKYGCDCYRMYEMFLGPVELSKPWNTNGIDGVAKFLRKYWNLYFDEQGEWIVSEEEPTKEEYKVLHKTIKKISDDIERFSMNTCISTFMICVNELGALKTHKKEILQPLAILLSPFAPHIAEYIWSHMEPYGSCVDAAFPVFNQEFVTEREFDYPVSINGKTRTKLLLSLELSAEQVEQMIASNDLIAKWLEEKPIKKVIFVKGRMINIVV